MAFMLQRNTTAVVFSDVNYVIFGAGLDDTS